MEEIKIDTEKAIEIVKEYFVKLKGANIQVGSRKLIDWLGFDVIKAKEENDQFVINCELLENFYSSKKEKYNIIVNKMGKIIEVVKENGQT
ncbi:hypothetical protein HYY69_02180 [Candidatus Woesearchaeota archaeon]|nr:hypothetical protein [Candidatus Woesearchaeota archaeon]